jgi:hypothetical protein
MGSTNLRNSPPQGWRESYGAEFMAQKAYGKFRGWIQLHTLME